MTKGKATKEKILEEAVELFYAHGFAKASTRQLVGKVGMTSSAIYNHFSNKEEILFSIIQSAGDKVLATLKKVIEEYDDPVECLKQMISGMLYLFSEGGMRKEIAIFIDELYQLPEDLRELCNRQHRDIFKLFYGKIKEMDDISKINPIDHNVAAFGVLGAMLWVYHWFRENGRLPMQNISNELTKLLFDGLMKREQSSTP
ncbi:MAG: TetR/AcrR family transcriptional regulator [Deltaproteobacteria bacterium]|nr:TetR/AcrR family transcriptional regulator [Deltaproteobacteria bacterium]